MGETVSVDGDENLRRTLDRAEDELANMDQSGAARLIQQRGAARAPKLTGALARSVTAKDIGGGKAVVGSDLVYASVIHYGSAARNIRPQPFLTTAVDDSVSLVEAEDLRLANAALNKVKGA